LDQREKIFIIATMVALLLIGGYTLSRLTGSLWHPFQGCRNGAAAEQKHGTQARSSRQSYNCHRLRADGLAVQFSDHGYPVIQGDAGMDDAVLDHSSGGQAGALVVTTVQRRADGNGQRRFVAGSAARSIAVVIAAVLCGAGCLSIGPQTIPQDRVDYLDSIGESWKRQTLLNILRLRYMDTPMFLDVSSIVASYGVGATIGADAKVGTTGAAASASQVGVAGSANFTNNPTITYVPMMGSKFLRSLIESVPPMTVLSLVEVGYPADFVLELGVDSINGLRNRSDHAGRVRRADPAFLRLASLLGQIQDEGGMGLRVEESGDKQPKVVLFFHPERMTSETLASTVEVRQLLGLAEDFNEYTIVFSPGRGKPDELAINSRSVMQMMAALATFVEIPPEDIAAGAATPAPDTKLWAKPLLQVFSGTAPPRNAFVSVKYHNHWFWINDGDWRSKRTLSTVLFLFTLTETEASGRIPVVTIPVR
jgi:hypothetical protein